MCFTLAKQVLRKKIHLQQTKMVQAWNNFAVEFGSLPGVNAFETIQGQTLRKLNTSWMCWTFR